MNKEFTALNNFYDAMIEESVVVDYNLIITNKNLSPEQTIIIPLSSNDIDVLLKSLTSIFVNITDFISIKDDSTKLGISIRKVTRNLDEIYTITLSSAKSKMNIKGDKEMMETFIRLLLSDTDILNI